MKTSILLLISFTILITSNSFSTPLNGTYTIGSGGNYPTINSALDDAMNQGISGPVIFEIITGHYYENIEGIKVFAGSNEINTVTLKSQSGNRLDVIITPNDLSGFSFSAANMVFRDLYFDSFILFHLINNVSFINNYIHVVELVGEELMPSYDLNFIGNYTNIYTRPSFLIKNINIKNNTLGFLLLYNNCRIENVLVENNTISRIETDSDNVVNNFKCFKNNISGGTIYAINVDFYNNFIFNTTITGFGSLINNTIVYDNNGVPTLFSLKNVKNNIIINTAGYYAVIVYDTKEISNSDYNVFYNGGNNYLIGYNGVSYISIQDFFNATGLDQHSSDQPVNFVSPTDLHLAPTSFGDTNLIGIPDTNIVDDIDGQTRSLTSPYKGADEPDIPLPVELSVFNSSINVNNVNLYWTTTSETNNLGFVIERSINNLEWLNVNFVQGHGTTTAINNYEYSDKGLNPGKYNYRLKQLDYNGNFEYYNLSEEVLIGSPDKFSLSQNYPNPFNPNTIINYQLANNSHVTIKVYDISGKEVSTLLNQFKVAGSYSINFNGSSFASGVYYYKIIAGNFISTKKMLLLK